MGKGIDLMSERTSRLAKEIQEHEDQEVQFEIGLRGLAAEALLAKGATRDGLVYITEQRMLPFKEKDCIFCAGRHCAHCNYSGKLFHVMHEDQYERVMADWDNRKNVVVMYKAPMELINENKGR